MKPLELAVDAVAAYRLTRLVTADVLTQPAREVVIERAYGRGQGRAVALRLQASAGVWADPDRWQQTVELDQDPPRLAQLVTCRWCAGVWVAAGVVLARRVAPRWWQPVAEGLTAATAAALIAGLED